MEGQEGEITNVHRETFLSGVYAYYLDLWWYVKTYQTDHLKYVQFIVCEL